MIHMGFGSAAQSMTNQAISNAGLLFGDFWPVVAFFVGLSGLAFIVGIFLNRGKS